MSPGKVGTYVSLVYYAVYIYTVTV